MIVVETVKFGEREFKRTYSDKGFIIQKVGTNEKYSEAVDVIGSEFEYVETKEKCESEE